MNRTGHRPLPEMPDRIERLPVDKRGYPIPWFVAWLHEGEEVERGEGEPDFRIMCSTAIREALDTGRCWVCGQTLGSNLAFNIGPMCAVNRISAEPPSHRDCADWSARACPFLSKPKASRREAKMPEETKELPGVAIMRNPGVALVWVTRKYELKPVDNGVLFEIGDPQEVRWYAEGREATREEIMHSIDSGMPRLREMCFNDRDERQLTRQYDEAVELVPA